MDNSKLCLAHSYRIVILCGAAVMLGVGCWQGTSSTSSQSDFTPPGDLIGTFRYVASADSLHYYPDTAIACKDSQLVRTSPGQGVKVGISNRADTLILHAPAILVKDSSAYVQHLTWLTRKTGASGIEGIWRNSGQSFGVTSGALSENEKASRKQAQAWMDSLQPFSTLHYVFEGGWLKIYADVESAALFVKSWNLFDPVTGQEWAGAYDIQVRQVGKQDVELAGGKTGEKVSINIRNDGTRVYTSSDPLNAPHRFGFPPQSCPMSVVPAWYNHFLMENLKPAP